MEYQSVIKVSSNIIWHFYKAMMKIRGKSRTLAQNQAIEVLFLLPNLKKDPDLRW